MDIRLTQSGRKAFGLDEGRTIISVSTARAYALMEAGYAVNDAGFMRLYAVNNPAPIPETREEHETAEAKSAKRREKN